MFSSPEAQFAIEAVREASLLARRIQRDFLLQPGDTIRITERFF